MTTKIHPENSFTINWSASCTREQAVLYCLGIGDGAIYERNDEIDPDQIPLGDGLLTRLDITLDEYWKGRYRRALRIRPEDLQASATEEDYWEAINLKEHAILATERMIEKSRDLLIVIVDEISKGAESSLRIDLEMTRRTGIEHITLKSLKEWVSARHKEAAESPTGQYISQELEQIEDSKNFRRPEEMSKTERSLYITLALCAEACAEKLGTRYLKDDGKVNESQLTELISSYAESQCKEHPNFPSQSSASVRPRLALARKCKDHALRELGLF